MLHTLITLLVGAGLYPLNLHREGMLMAAMFYLGREHTQAEYRSITTYYDNHRARAPWWCGFEPRAWSGKSVLDWLLPLFLAVVTSILVGGSYV